MPGVFLTLGDPECVTRPHPPPLAVMFYDKVKRPLSMTILLLTCPALSPPPDHHQPSEALSYQTVRQVTPFLFSAKCSTNLRAKFTGRSAPAPRLKTAPEKTNDSARPGSSIKAGNLHPYRLPSDHADDPFTPFSDHDVKDLLQLNNLLGADVTQPNPLLLDKDILMSPIIPNPSTLLSSPRPPDPHL